MANDLHEEALTHSVIGAFYEVYNTLKFGLLEPFYAKALERELTWHGHRVAREVSVTVLYKGEELGQQRLDMIVDEKLVVEIKSTYDLHRAATRQVLSYLRASYLKVGLLLHFGPEPAFYRLIDTDKRRHRPDSPPPRDPRHPTS